MRETTSVRVAVMCLRVRESHRVSCEHGENKEREDLSESERDSE